MRIHEEPEEGWNVGVPSLFQCLVQLGQQGCWLYMLGALYIPKEIPLYIDSMAN